MKYSQTSLMRPPFEHANMISSCKDQWCLAHVRLSIWIWDLENPSWWTTCHNLPTKLLYYDVRILYVKIKNKDLFTLKMYVKIKHKTQHNNIARSVYHEKKIPQPCVSARARACVCVHASARVHVHASTCANCCLCAHACVSLCNTCIGTCVFKFHESHKLWALELQ